MSVCIEAVRNPRKRVIKTESIRVKGKRGKNGQEGQVQICWLRSIKVVERKRSTVPPRYCGRGRWHFLGRIWGSFLHSHALGGRPRAWGQCISWTAVHRAPSGLDQRLQHLFTSSHTHTEMLTEQEQCLSESCMIVHFRPLKDFIGTPTWNRIKMRNSSYTTLTQSQNLQ